MSLRFDIIDGIIEREGGFVDDPADSGGATKYGITERVARRNGYAGDMRHFPRDKAFEIYVAQYWDAVRADDIEAASPEIAAEVVDTAVNMGVARAGEFLQRSLNVLNRGGTDYVDLIIDGSIGPATIDALRTFLNTREAEGEIVLFRALNCLQGAKYIELSERREKDERFVFGWLLHRVQ